MTTATETSPGLRVGRPRPNLRSWDSGSLALVILLAAELLVFLAFWPGIINADDNQTIYEAQVHLPLDWWTGFGAVALRYWYAIGLGLPLVYAVAVTLNVVGGYLCMRLALRRVPAAIATIFFVGYPPDYGQLSDLSRGTFFLGFTFLSFGLLGLMVRGARRRRTLAVVAVLLTVLGFLCRQNGIAVVFAVACFVNLYARRVDWRSVVRAAVIGIVVSVAAYAGSLAFYAIFDVRAVHGERQVYTYDIAAISVLSGHDYFPESMIKHWIPGGAAPEKVDEASLRRLFEWNNVISLYPDNQAAKINFSSVSIAKKEDTELEHAWFKAVEAQPLDWIYERLRLGVSQLGITRPPTDAFVPEVPGNYGHPVTFYHGYDAAAHVLKWFVGPSAKISLDRVWIYLLISAGCFVYLWRRVVALRLFIAALALAVVCNQVFMFFAEPASGWRYADLVVPCTLILIVFSLAVRLRDVRPFARLTDVMLCPDSSAEAVSMGTAS